MIKKYLNEIWRDIPGYEGYYQVSNYGRVKSLERLQKSEGKSAYLVSEKIMISQKGKNGYLQVNLYKNGKNTTKTIHRLVAQAFIPNPNNLPCVNHKDEDRTNNFVFINPDGSVNPEKSNLEWCSYKYNNTYGGRIKKVLNKMCKPCAQYTLEGELVKVWSSFMDIQRTLGIPNTSIVKCCKGKYKQAYGYIWKYA